MTLAPRRRIVNGGDDRLDGDVALVHQGRVQTDERTIVSGIKLAYRAGIGVTVLIVALIRHDERKQGAKPAARLVKRPPRAFEAAHSLQAGLRIEAFLHVLEIKGCVSRRRDPLDCSASALRREGP